VNLYSNHPETISNMLFMSQAEQAYSLLCLRHE